MPRPKGSLNHATIQQMVDDGLICLLANRLSCLKCKAARESVWIPTAPVLADEPLAPSARAATPPVEAGPPAGRLVDTFVEYRAPDGREWRIERGVEMLHDFAIEPAQVKSFTGLWHAALAAQERVWLIVRRIYGVAPMLGATDPDELRVWTAEELGEKLGLSAEQIKATLGETRAFWARYRAANTPAEKKGVRLDAKAPMTGEQIDELLSQYGFDGVLGDTERRYAAKRCRDLTAYLENEQGMPIARSAIQQELNLMVLDARLSGLNAEHAARRAENAKAVFSATEDKRVTDLMEARNKANAGYVKTMESLGATQVQTGSVAKRMNAQVCVGTMNEAIQRYYANAENALIDFFATEGEIELTVREKELRPMQYRPDVVVAAHEAMEHLWDKDFEPSPIGRMKVRRLRAAFRDAVRASLAEDGEVVVDSAEEEMMGDAQGPPLPAALPAGMAEEAGPPNGAHPMTPRPRGGGDEVAVF